MAILFGTERAARNSGVWRLTCENQLTSSVGRGCPYPVAGRSLRPSWAALTRTWPRSAIHGSACQLRRLRGMGNPSLIQ